MRALEKAGKVTLSLDGKGVGAQGPRRRGSSAVHGHEEEPGMKM